jgi:hypothetical protein
MVTIFIALSMMTFIVVVLGTRHRRRIAQKQTDINRELIRARLLQRSDDYCRRVNTDRETIHWSTVTYSKDIRDIRYRILRELPNLKPTEWEHSVIDAINEKSPKLLMYLTKGKLDIEILKEREKEGIDDAIRVIARTPVDSYFKLRAYFHDLFENIVDSCKSENRFYLYGQQRVIQMLRCFKASACEFEPVISKAMCEKDKDEKTVGIFETLAYQYRWCKNKKRDYKDQIHRDNPIIEFNLDAIRTAEQFKYKGSLINSLFIELHRRLCELTNDYPMVPMGQVETLFDGHYLRYDHGGVGHVYLVKVVGAVDYYPDYLLIEFENIAPDAALLRELRAYKLHIEGND